MEVFDLALVAFQEESGSVAEGLFGDGDLVFHIAYIAFWFGFRQGLFLDPELVSVFVVKVLEAFATFCDGRLDLFQLHLTPAIIAGIFAHLVRPVVVLQ
jgi:hypothetical protein